MTAISEKKRMLSSLKVNLEVLEHDIVGTERKSRRRMAICTT